MKAQNLRKKKPSMFLNYLLASYRSIKRDRFFALVNLLSVAIAFTLGTITYFNQRFNDTFNTFFRDAENIYKVNAQEVIDHGDLGLGISPLPLASFAQSNLGDEIQVARFVAQQRTIKVENDLFREKVGFVDESFLDMFQYPLLESSGSTLLSRSSVVVSQELAIRLFGESDAVDKTLTLINHEGMQETFVISGVLADWPANTSFRFSMLMSIDHYVEFQDLREGDWSQWVDGTFLQIPDGKVSPILQLLNGALPQQNVANPHKEIATYQLQSLLEWPQYESALANSRFMSALHPASMIGMISSAVCLLLLAAFNFANTTIAISAKRLKEIGIRKVLGGSRRDIIIQVFVESLIQLLAGLLLSLILLIYVVPQFNALFETEVIQWSFVDIPHLVSFLVVLWISMATLAAAYPALYISRLQSLEIFREKVKLGAKNYFTKAMLVFEFIVVFYNLFALGAYSSNSRYQEKLDKGYELAGLINIPLEDPSNFHPLKQSLAEMAGVEELGGSQSLIGFGAPEVTIENRGDIISSDALHLTSPYLEMLKVRLQKGRFFIRKEALNEVLINDLLHRQLGGEMLNQPLKIGEKFYTVIGIVDDFKNRSIMMDGRMSPTVIFQAQEADLQYVTVRTREDDIAAQDKRIASTWQALFPDLLYRGFYQEEAVRSVRHTNEIIITINSFVAVVSICICVLGLYSLVSLGIQRRRKEFGIRKVLGATVSQIFLLINRDIGLLILLGALVGLPFAGYFTKMIMDIIFAYHIDLTAGYYVLPIIVVFTIALCSVGLKAWKNAASNPVNHLRSE